MRYISTRGRVEAKGFIDTVLMGLADDGGLMVPEQIPTVSAATLEQWATLSYRELLLEVFALYINDEIPREDLEQLVERSYASFRHPEVTPVKKINDSLSILELFHGPTFAFKDVALQFMGEFIPMCPKSRMRSFTFWVQPRAILGRQRFRACVARKALKSVFCIHTKR